MEKKKERKWVAISEEDKKILDKLAKRYGKSKTAFISLLLSNANYYGIVEEDEQGKNSEFDKLRKSVKSFNDSAWSGIAQQRENYNILLGAMEKALQQMHSNNLMLAKVVENEGAEKGMNSEQYKTFVNCFNGLAKWCQAFEAREDEREKKTATELAEIKQELEFIKNKKRSIFG